MLISLFALVAFSSSSPATSAPRAAEGDVEMPFAK
jgi:hypothetical protein